MAVVLLDAVNVRHHDGLHLGADRHLDRGAARDLDAGAGQLIDDQAHLARRFHVVGLHDEAASRGDVGSVALRAADQLWSPDQGHTARGCRAGRRGAVAEAAEEDEEQDAGGHDDEQPETRGCPRQGAGPGVPGICRCGSSRRPGDGLPGRDAPGDGHGNAGAWRGAHGSQRCRPRRIGDEARQGHRELRRGWPRGRVDGQAPAHDGVQGRWRVSSHQASAKARCRSGVPRPRRPANRPRRDAGR